MPDPFAPADVFDKPEPYAPPDVFDSGKQKSAPAASPGFLDSIASYIPQPVKDVWNRAEQPLTDLPTRAGKAISDYLDPTQYTNPVARFAAAYPEALGQTVSGLTSPLNLGITALTGGAGAIEGQLPNVARAARIGAGVASLPMMATGANTAFNPNLPIDERLSGAVQGLMGGVGALEGVRGIRGPGIRNVRLTESPALGITQPESAQMQLTFDNQANDIIKKSPQQQAQPQPTKLPESQAIQVEQQKAQQQAFNPYASNAPNAQPVRPQQPNPIPEFANAQPPNLAEAADHINQTADMAIQQMNEQQPVPVEGVNPPPPTLDTEAQALRDQTARPQTPIERARMFAGGDEQYAQGRAKASGIQASVLKKAQSATDLRPEPGERTSAFQKRSGIPFSQAEALVRDASLQQAIREQHYPSTGVPEGFNDTSKGPIIKNGIRQPQEEYPGYKGEISNEESVASEATPEDIAKAQQPGLISNLWKNTEGSMALPGNKGPVQKRLPLSGKAIPENPEQAGIIRDTLNKQRAILTSFDLSAPGRQGKAFMLNKEWWTSLDDMMAGWSSKEKADAVHDSIINNPSGYFKPNELKFGRPSSFADRVGLSMPEHEEVFTSKTGKIFGNLVNKSSRAHTAFLNKLRSDVFVKMMQSAKDGGLITDAASEFKYGQKYAEFINNATGRGKNLVNIEIPVGKNTITTSDVFFAPRNLSGQVRTWGKILDPRTYSSTDPVMRQQAIKSLLSIAALPAVASQLTQLTGANVSLNPTSADFLKSRYDNSRIDWGGGYNQIPVLAAKLLSGQSTSTIPSRRTGQYQTTNLYSPKFGQASAKDTAERFFAARLAPLPSLVWSFASGRDFDGQPFEVKRALFNRTFPIALNDILQVAKDNPALGIISAPTTLMGITNTQNYGGR